MVEINPKLTFSKKSTFTFLLSFFWFVRLDDLGGRLEFREVAVLPEKLHLAAIIVMAGEFKVNFGPRLKGRCLNGLCWRKISSNSLARLKVHWLMLWLVCIYYTAPSTTKTWSRRPPNWGLNFLIGFTKYYFLLSVASLFYLFYHQKVSKRNFLTWNCQTGNSETVRCSFKPILSTYGPSKTNANLFTTFMHFWEKKCMNWLQFLLLLFSVKSQKGIRQKINYFLSRSCISAWGNYYHFLEKRSHLQLSF